MIKLSDFFSKPVLSIYDGTSEGIIKTAFFDKKFKRLKYFILFDDMDKIIEEKVLAIDKIYNAGENAVVIKNNSNIDLLKSVEAKFEKRNPINCQVFDTMGKFLGTITDVKMNDNFFVESVVLNNAFDLPIDIFVSSQDYIFIVQNKANPVKLHNLRPRKDFPKPQQPKQEIFTLTSENEIIKRKLEQSLNNGILPLNAKTPTIRLNSKKSDTLLPNKVTSNVNFILGRKATKNIYSPSNEIIVKRNTIINANNIELARKYGKIKELATFSI